MALQTTVTFYDSADLDTRAKCGELTFSSAQVVETIAYSTLRPGDSVMINAKALKIKSEPVKVLSRFVMLVDYVVEATQPDTTARTYAVR